MSWEEFGTIRNNVYPQKAREEDLISVLRIRGGKALRGTVAVSGSKNAALAILSGALLAHEPITLKNVPKVIDIEIKLDLLRDVGAEVEQEGNTVWIDPSRIRNGTPSPEKVRAIRTSFYLMGPLLARLGRASLPQPGGCRIGARPVDFHVKGLSLLGAQIELTGGIYEATTQGLKGAEIYLDFPSAGATQHLMAAACTAEGQTVIKNAAMEPEVVAMADFLNLLGAKIEGAGSSTIVITGVPGLKGGVYTVFADRLQAGTYLIAGAATNGDVTVTAIVPEHQAPVINKLKEAGAHVDLGEDWVRVRGTRYLQAISVKTMPYPGFPTDIQQPMCALLATAHGVSTVEETIYESRIGHIAELNRMGAKIRLEGRTSVITGVDHLHGTVVEATDLRAGAALAIAGLMAQGETIVKNLHHIDRGYENFDEILRSLGGDVERLETAEVEGVLR
jgi:UDP-N-acetylglucosamine 1-carboxyvinyltransferase